MKTFLKYLTTIVLALSFASVTAQTDEKMIRKGNRQYRKSNFTEAEVNYKKALEARPNNANAQFNLGDALFAQQNYDAAYEAFQKVVEMSPDAKLKSNAVYNMGNCLLEQGKFYDAFNIYKVSLKLNPENENALYNLEYCRAHLVKSRIQVVQPEHGRVEVSEMEAFNGQCVTLSSKADDNYALSSYIVVRADNQEVRVDVSGNSFIMPNAVIQRHSVIRYACNSSSSASIIRSSGSFFTISPCRNSTAQPSPPAMPKSASRASPGPLTAHPIRATLT